MDKQTALPIQTVTGLQTTAEGETLPVEMALPVEHKIDIYVDGELYRPVICTPTMLPQLVLGRLVTDGVIWGIEEVAQWAISPAGDRADVALSHKPRPERERRDAPAVTDGMIRTAQAKLAEGNPLYKATRGVHCCILIHGGELRYVTEDLSRHSALDKAVGSALLDGVELGECVLFSSGRVPTDMLQKSINAGIRALIAKAIPTYQSVELARKQGITLICDARGGKYAQFSPLT